MSGSATVVGKRYKFYYRGGVQGEEILEDRSEGEPAKVILGLGNLPKGIEDALETLKPGEETTAVIPPEKAYGYHSDEFVKVYPRVSVGVGAEYQKGDWIPWKNVAAGQTVPVKVLEADKDFVTLDFNHPLAGKTLEYWLKVVDIAG